MELASSAGFEAEVAPHRRALLSYCYRMLGSWSDAEDAVQEALVRAWKGLAGFEGRSQLRSWLFQIATRTCLDLIAQRKRRHLPDEVHPAATVGDAPTVDPLHDYLQPAPASALDLEPGPETVVSRRESVALAFMVTLQALPGTQRAALVLKDVLGFSAEETAQQLESTVPAVNSMLQRARASLDEASPRWKRRDGEETRVQAGAHGGIIAVDQWGSIQCPFCVNREIPCPWVGDCGAGAGETVDLSAVRENAHGRIVPPEFHPRRSFEKTGNEEEICG